MANSIDAPRPNRKTPAHGVHGDPESPVIVFVTACTRDREHWLATEDCHRRLLDSWRDAEAWTVGRYVLMPDHMHLFAAPNAPEAPLESWMRFWKTSFSQRIGKAECRWQKGHWDRRLRHRESYEEKWDYVRNNPVRHGLVGRAEEWPYQGEINSLPW